MKLKIDFVNERNMGLLTDLYELTMCQSYFEHERFEPATFDLFIRKMPPDRAYFIFAGLEEALFYLKNIKFEKDQLDYLREQGFKKKFLNYLKNFKFEGDVYSLKEGSIVFPDEPMLRVTAPLPQAQLVETFLLNAINLQTTIATKASRVVYAAKGKAVVDFSLRRTQGTDAGLKVARASYIAGCSGTSNVLAGKIYGIPVFGTMAHSYVQSYEKEIDAFKAFVESFPKKTTLLIDTYDTLKGARKAVLIAKELEKKGYKLGGVRLDSGDLIGLSKKVRRILDEHGLKYVKIFASGNLDEYKIQEMLRKNAKIDAFGVGTAMGTSSDYPYVDIVYKLSEVFRDGSFVPVMKLSKNKVTLPGRKQVFRIKRKGKYVKDVISLEDEKVEGNPLLIPVMKKGKLVYDLPSLEEIREYTLKNLSELPEKYKRLKKAPKYPVELSPKLEELLKKEIRKLRMIE